MDKLIKRVEKRKQGDYIIIIDHDNYHYVSLKHKDGRTWSDTVRAISHLINEAKPKKDRRGLVWEGNIGGDPNNPFPLKPKKK